MDLPDWREIQWNNSCSKRSRLARSFLPIPLLLHCSCSRPCDGLFSNSRCLQLDVLHCRFINSDSQTKPDLLSVVLWLFGTLAHFKMVQKEVCIFCTFPSNNQLNTHSKVHNTAPWLPRWWSTPEVWFLLYARRGLLSLWMYICQCLSFTINSFHRNCDFGLLISCNVAGITFMVATEPTWWKGYHPRNNLSVFSRKHF